MIRKALTRRAFAAAAVAPAFLRARSQSRPNLLLLMADQHRGDCLGADGNTAVSTPNLDRIANEGIRFRCAYSSTPTCTPARSALLTGMSPWNHGMLGYGRVAERYPVEMPRVLRDAGYYTTGIGKMHWSPQRNLHGFDRTILDESGREESVDFRSDYRAWFATEAPGLDPDATGIGWNDHRAAEYVLPERLHPTTWTADVATRFIETYNRPQPFFLKVSFARPHSPYDPPTRWMKAYSGASLPPAAVGAWASRWAPRNTEANDLWHGGLGPEQVRRSRQGYFGSVSHVDEQIGRVLASLEKRNLLEQTLVIYISDHGDMTGDHNLWRKSYAYEASSRIPMLVRWPSGMVSAKRGQVSAAPVEIRDIAATLFDAGGATPPAAIDGRSLLDIARGQAQGWREYIDLEHNICYSPENNWNALTDGRWKYIYHAQDGHEQLFNLIDDPREMKDLSADANSAAELRLWRGRMTDLVSVRGGQFVENGRLRPRPAGLLYSPNYPVATKAAQSARG